MSLTPQISPRDHVIAATLDAPLVVVHLRRFRVPVFRRARRPYLASNSKRNCGDEMCLIFRAFPLVRHCTRTRIGAALAAEAAGESFWPMHDLLFANQRNLSDAALVDYAAQLGIEGEAFAAAMNADSTRARIESSVENGRRSGAHGTPTLWINGEFHDNDEQLWKRAKLLPLLQSALAEN